MLTELLNMGRVSLRLCGSVATKTETGSLDSNPAETGSAALRIVHAGGIVECYYMAVPAAMIMEKYPAFILARPQVFREPWGSVVRADETLVPGEKLLVVSRGAVEKLRRRIGKPIMGDKRKGGSGGHIAWQPSLISIDEI